MYECCAIITLHRHWVKKAISLRGNIRDTTLKPQVYNKLPWGFHPGN